jgi:hypothetical protein
MEVVKTILAQQLDTEAIDTMSEAGEQLIEELGMQHPIQCRLFDQSGAEIAHFVGDSAHPTERSCDELQARLRSETGASLKLVDRNGVEAEVLLVIVSGPLQ